MRGRGRSRVSTSRSGTPMADSKSAGFSGDRPSAGTEEQTAFVSGCRSWQTVGKQ